MSEAEDRLAAMLGRGATGDVSQLEVSALAADLNLRDQKADKAQLEQAMRARASRAAQARADQEAADRWAQTVADGLAEGEQVRIGDVLDARPDGVPVLAAIEAFNELLGKQQIHREGHADLAVFVGRKR